MITTIAFRMIRIEDRTHRLLLLTLLAFAGLC